MQPLLGIIEANFNNAQVLLVNFTDGTYSSFSAEELAALHPIRATGEGENAEEGQ